MWSTLTTMREKGFSFWYIWSYDRLCRLAKTANNTLCTRGNNVEVIGDTDDKETATRAIGLAICISVISTTLTIAILETLPTY